MKLRNRTTGGIRECSGLLPYQSTVCASDWRRPAALAMLLALIAATLAGCAIAPPSPHLAIAPSPLLTFADTIVGDSSPKQTLTLTNTGDMTVTITGEHLIDGGEFQLENPKDCGTILPGSSCGLSFTFNPQLSGPRNGMITVLSDAAGGPQTVILRGTGFPGKLAITPNPLNFPDTVVGSPVFPTLLPLALMNAGKFPVHVSATTLSGANPGDFNLLPLVCRGGPGIVAPGESCPLVIFFIPSAAGLRTATLNVVSDAVGSPQTVTFMGNGLAPTKILTLTPNPLNLPDTVVGSDVIRFVSIKSVGNAPVHISGTSFTGGEGFLVGSLTCDRPGDNIVPGEFCGINFTFAPSAPGPHTGTLTITSDAAGSPQTVTINGNGVAQTKILTLAPNSLIFPDTEVGIPSLAQTITVTNVGNTAVQLFPTSVGGANAADFLASNVICPTGSDHVAPGASCAINVQFKPGDSGLRNATVTVTSDATGSPQTVKLTGNGVRGTLTLTPNPLNFPDTVVGRQSAPLTVTVANNTSVPVRLAAIDFFGGANPGDFAGAALPNACGKGTGTVSPGTSCPITFTFNPTAAGPRSATVTITSNGTGSPQIVTLTGNGLAPTKILTLTPAPLIFPDTPVGHLSAPQTLTVTNVGNTVVQIAGISLGGPGANLSDFQITTNLCQTPTSGSVAPGASCTLGLTFNPQAAGARMATLTVSSDATGSPQMVALNGNGIPGSLSLTPNPLILPDTVVGVQSAARTLTVTNTGPALVRFNSISVGGANASDFQIATNRCITPTTGALPANASCTIDFTFTPQTAGARMAILTISSDGAGSPQTVTLNGNGLAPTKVLTLAPNPLNFPDTAVGSTSASLVINVTSTGTSPVSISSVTLTGSNPGDFTTTSNTCPVPPAVLSAGCTVSVAFAPTAAGARSASFTVTSDAAGSPQTVALTGKGIAPATTTPRFAYQGNPDGTVSIFTVNPATGRLQARGFATVPLLGSANFPVLALDPQNRFVFYGAANSVLPSSSVFTFAVDSATGALTLQPGSNVISGSVSAAVVDPSGRFLYAGGGSPSAGQVSAYSINATTGALTQITGSPFTTGAFPRIAIDPSGKFLYASDSLGVSAFAIDQTTGALSSIAGSPFAAGVVTPDAIITDPKGKFVYFLSNSSVFAFAINATSGVLTAVPGSPFAPPAANLVRVSIAIDPTGAFVYVTNNSQVQGTSSVSAYTVDATSGALTSVPGSPFSTGIAEPSWVSVDPSGAFLYVPSFDTTAGGIIETFSIAPGTGVLTPSPLGTTLVRLFPHTPVQLGISSGAAQVRTTPQYVLVANSGSNDVSAYAISPASGALTAVAGSPFVAGTSPMSVSTDLLGRFAYVANSGSNDISAFAISPATGTLAPVTGSPFTTGGTGSQSVVVDGSSEFVYAGNSVSQNISEFALNPATGALSAISGSPLAASFSVTALSGNPTGQQIFAAGAGIGNFALGNFYDVNVNGNPGSANVNGVLSLANTLNTGSALQASSVAVHPSGKFAYITNLASNSMTGNALTCCQAVPVPGSPFPTGVSPTAIAIEPLGRFLYVANSGSNNISAYSIDPATGTASPLPGSPFAARTNPSDLAVDGSGKFLLVTNKGDNTLSVFTIDSSTGALTAIAGSPFVTGTAPAAITVINKVQ